MVGAQHRHPAGLLGERRRGGALRQVAEPLEMAPARRIRIVLGDQLQLDELPDGLGEPVPCPRAAVLGHDQRAVHQPGDHLGYVAGSRRAGAGDAGRGVGGEPAHEDGETGQVRSVSSSSE